jgi:manganese-dependent inorganic pyrophosphatase
MGKGGGCGASGSPAAVDLSESEPESTQARTPAAAAAASSPAHAKAVAAVEALLASVRAAGPEVDMDEVLSHVQSAQSAAVASAAEAVAAPAGKSDAPSSDQIKGFAQELMRTASRGQSKAEAFIERFAVSRILRGATFVGHINTDLDSIAGAIGAANLYEGTAAKAQKELNGEITYALEFAGLPEPTLFDELDEAARSRVCLVDHNEEKQMVSALREDPDRASRIVGLIDHHAIAESYSTKGPTFMDVRPWGSMASIVAHSYIRDGRTLERPYARILLCAILSDTLALRSPTTTQADRLLASLLSVMGGVDEPQELAKRMFRAKTNWIVNLGPTEMVRGDQKDFNSGVWKLGISVLEVTTIEPVLEQAENILTEMRMFKHEKGWQYDDDYNRTVNVRSDRLDFFFVFVVDVVAQKGYLLVCGDRELELAQIAFPDGELSTACESIQPPGKTLTPEQTLLSVGSRVSRKKEYAPPLLTACETFTRSKDPATGRVEDAQEEEDGSLEGVEVTYKQGGEQLEIDYDVFKKGFHEVGTAASQPASQRVLCCVVLCCVVLCCVRQTTRLEDSRVCEPTDTSRSSSS